jgi:tellurite resistance protein
VGGFKASFSRPAWQTPKSPAQSAARGESYEEQTVAEANSEADWILKAMIVVASSDGGLDERETSLIQQVYQDQSGRALSADDINREAAALAKGDAIAQFAAAAKVLDNDAKEEVIRAAYLVLLADERIAGEERKKLKDIAAALQIPEIHFGAILEDLAIWLAQQKS